MAVEVEPRPRQHGAPFAGRLRIRLARCLLGCLAACVAWLAQAEPTASADELKAAYLFRFLGYVEWPATTFAGPDVPIVIGVAGAEALLPLLNSVVEGRTVQGRAVVTRHMAPGDALRGVQVLFVGRDVDAPSAWIRAAHDRAVLVVTETPEGLARGAVLNFVRVGDRIRFEASVAAAERSGLKLSSRLLAVASSVRREP
jgi:YfiR/HmsC-like